MEKRITIYEATIHGPDARAKAERIAERLHDKTFFDFRVEYGIIPGPGYMVSISANTEEDRVLEAMQMAFSVLAGVV